MIHKIQIKNSWITEWVEIGGCSYKRIAWKDGCATWVEIPFMQRIEYGTDFWNELENAYQNHIRSTNSQTSLQAEKSDDVLEAQS